MTKLYFDYTNIENTVITNLETSIKYLNYAINECRNMVIPSDYDFSQYLKQLGNNNYNTLVSLSNKKDILKNSITSYKKIESANAEEFSKIPDLNIPVRKNTLI